MIAQRGEPNSRRVRALIADGEAAARRRVRSLLERDPAFEIVAEACGGIEAADLILRLGPELVFLGVQMDGCDGFETLRRVGGSPPATIFIAEHAGSALRAFEFRAVDCLLKPCDELRFDAALCRARDEVERRRCGHLSDRLSRVLERAESRERERIAFKAAGETVLLRTADIDWISAEGDYVKIHVSGKAHLVRGTMASMGARLDPSRFVRIHRSAIVNADSVRRLGPSVNSECSVVLHDGTRLRLSRGYPGALGAILDRCR